MAVPQESIIDQIPTATEVRDRLGNALVEVAVLRRLLNVAKRADEHRQARDDGQKRRLPRECPRRKSGRAGRAADCPHTMTWAKLREARR